MIIRCIWEHNGDDTLLYAEEYPGAYARGESLEEALGKMEAEIHSFLRWSGQPCDGALETMVVQEKNSNLAIRDADSDVIFDSERMPLTLGEYLRLKEFVLRSAHDFWALYESIPDKEHSCLAERSTFYGAVPRTAEEMYQHTKSVNAYYFGEIGVEADNGETIAECRKRGFARLESMPDFLTLPPCEGNYGEEWSLRKMLRRFLWHDRIHAKAMYRMAVKTFGQSENPFCF